MRTGIAIAAGGTGGGGVEGDGTTVGVEARLTNAEGSIEGGGPPKEIGLVGISWIGTVAITEAHPAGRLPETVLEVTEEAPAAVGEVGAVMGTTEDPKI